MEEIYTSLQGPPVFSLVCIPERAIFIGTSEYAMKEEVRADDANELNVAYIFFELHALMVHVEMIIMH